MDIRAEMTRTLCVAITCLLVSVAMSAETCSASSETIEISTNMSPLDMERLAAGVVLGDDNNIYVFGGYRYNYTNWDTTASTVMIYNTTTGETRYGASMASGVAWPSCAQLLDGRMIVIGGYNSAVQNGTKTVRIYDPRTDTWTTNSSTPTNVSRASTAVGPNGNVYVFGPSGSQNSTLIYDHVNDTWSYGADLAWGRSRHSSSAVVYNETAIYVIGGHHFEMIWIPIPPIWIPGWYDTDYVDIYNPATDSWTVGPSLNNVKYGGGAALARDGFIHYYGGQNWLGTCYDEIETLDVSSPGATWQVSSDEISEEKAHFGTVYDQYGRVFLVGGMDYPTMTGLDTVEMLINTEVSEINEIVIRSPADGSGVNGTVEIEVESQNQHMANVVVVDAYVDETPLESQLGGGATSWTFAWNASSLALNSSHELLVRAFYSDGSVSEDEATCTIVSGMTDETIEEVLWQIQEDLTATLEALADLTSDITSLEEMFTALSANVSAIQDDLASIRDEIQMNLSSVRTELDQVQSQLDSLAQAVADLESATSSDLSDLSDDLSSLTDALETVSASIADMQAALDELPEQQELNLTEVMDQLDSIMDALEDLNQTVYEVDESVGEAQGSADNAGIYALLAMALAILVLVLLSVGMFLPRKRS